MFPRRHVPGRSRGLIALVALGAIIPVVLSGALLSGAVSAETPQPATTGSAAPAGSVPAALQSQFRQAVDETMAEYGVPGAAVGVWVPGDGTWTAAAGLADIASNTPASTGTSWPLRSITKSYTVTLILQLVDQGALSLDDTIGKYVDGVTNGDTITLRQLANMTSGNADYTNEKFADAYEADPARLFTLAELNSFMLGMPEQFSPGAQHVYTNANTNLLGAVVEKVTGAPFAEVLNARILQPLGQKDTHYILDVNKWAEPHPSGYSPGEDGPEEQHQNLSIFGPAGSMVTTIDDARVWGEALATGALVAPGTQADRLKGTPLDAGPPYDIYGLGIGETDGWWGHNGEGLGFTAAIFHNPESGATIAVFMNLSNAVLQGHPADQLFRRLAHILESSTAGSLGSLGPLAMSVGST
ncbi:serine hydrolase [Dietzia sp. ANT_WB102]|uniref:serine hydrolase domain-containing protein n=1 Tax=Dietzia sp. ANT_WB102 TaxID=2597345 RepID=UPI0011EED31A|nr:serine hydrolase domain-containing protein [Dietzia sp. ANT_WB102]KAA0919265.1 beta-lactamase family protein [Dietzia sp. ANT_WB102]